MRVVLENEDRWRKRITVRDPLFPILTMIYDSRFQKDILYGSDGRFVCQSELFGGRRDILCPKTFDKYSVEIIVKSRDFSLKMGVVFCHFRV